MIAIAAVGTFIAACSTAGIASSAPKLNVKIGGQDKTMEISSGGVYYGNVISTAPGKPNIQTSCHDIVLANYQMDTKNMATMKKPMTAPDQMRVWFTLTGEEGTNTDSPFKVGTYDVKADKVNKVRTVVIATQADGKDKEVFFDTMSSVSKISGTVKITSVTADSVSGDIDLGEGDNWVKGSFTAKLPAKK